MDKIDRIDFLMENFMKRKFKSIGISNTHFAIVHMLLLSSNNPTGLDEEDLRMGPKKLYLSKEEF